MFDIIVKFLFGLLIFSFSVFWEYDKHKKKDSQKVPRNKPVAKHAQKKRAGKHSERKRKQTTKGHRSEAKQNHSKKKRLLKESELSQKKPSPAVHAKKTATEVAKAFREQPKKERLKSRLHTRKGMQSRYADRNIVVELSEDETRPKKDILHFHEDAVLQGMVWHEVLSSRQ